MDIKSMFIGGIVFLAVGGGLYSGYLKVFGKTAATQSEAYTLTTQCNSLLRSYDKTEIKDFIVKYASKKDAINESDAVITAVNVVLDKGSHPKATGMGQPLDACIESLHARLKEIDPEAAD